ncbi:ABC transporter permease [Streptomyces sp. WZ-12]|uniref:ABC transporter permease n=1 Tax=Streptomyces sp. WZ-12 TaxID=3030210 RepID=UPI002381044D|nr:ABC transporter permease [Streptomyces sp. WZ-12]
MTETTTPPATAATAQTPAPRRRSLVSLCLRQGRMELRQFARQRESMIFTFCFPLIMFTVFGSAFSQRLTPDVQFTQYLLAGIVASGLMSTGFQSLAITVPIERDNLALKRFAGTPMPRTVYFAGKIILVVATSAAQITLLFLIAGLCYGVPLPTSPARWLTFAWVGILGCAACATVGIALSNLIRSGRSASAVVAPFAVLLQFISGVYFVYGNVPGWLRYVAELFPVKWMAQGMRSALLPDSFASQEVGGGWQHPQTALVLAAWLLLGILFAARRFRWSSDG